MSNHSCFVKGLPDRARNGGNLGRRPRLDLNFNSTSFGRINAKPPSNKGWVASVLPIREAIAQETKTPLLILFATVFFVLLLVCANVAGLQLARASSRAHEMAVRTSYHPRRSGRSWTASDCLPGRLRLPAPYRIAR